ncbi:MAG: hypothetical protein LBP21_04650, partial [Synergistaceae bacterium]|nr:hypothetical protein [Synergistaceae bacterium]
KIHSSTRFFLDDLSEVLTLYPDRLLAYNYEIENQDKPLRTSWVRCFKESVAEFETAINKE